MHGIGHRVDHAANPRSDDGVDAGARAPDVCARLEGDMQGGPPGQLPRGGQRLDLRMGAAGPSMPAFSYDEAVPLDDTPDDGVGAGPPEASAGQPNGPPHRRH